MNILKKFFTRNEKEMVQYWKTGDSVKAKVYIDDKGSYVMQMQGEKYPFPGYPRGALLYGLLSPLKHEIKNQIFNDTWKMLEEKKSDQEIMDHLKKTVLPKIFEIGKKTEFDRIPPEKMSPAIKELYRVMSIVEENTKSKNVLYLKDILCFILQEDDAYRFRFQWMMKFFKYKFFQKNYLKILDYALSMLEHAETIGDMKERQRLFRRIIIFILKDPVIKNYFDMLFKELDWKKVQLSKADKYFFRAKYFKVDFPEDNRY